MSGLILRRRKPGRHARTTTELRREVPGRSLGEYLDARTLGVAVPTRHPAWLAEVRRELRERLTG